MAPSILFFEEQINQAALVATGGAFAAYINTAPALAAGTARRFFRIGTLDTNAQGTELNDLIANNATIRGWAYVGIDIHESNGRCRLALLAEQTAPAGTPLLLQRIRIRSWEQVVFKDTAPAAGATNFLSVEESDKPDPNNRLALTTHLALLTVRPVVMPGVADAVPVGATRAIVEHKVCTFKGLTRLVTVEYDADNTQPLP
jgi:hypothetical protein